MKLLFVDTETTGVVKKRKPHASDMIEAGVRLVQVGYMFWDTSDGGLKYGREYIIKPNGFTIPEEVSKLHGITQEIAEAQGHDLEKILRQLLIEIHVADFVIGHNAFFDTAVLGGEFIRVMDSNPFLGKAIFDTMLASVTLCKIPGPFGWKWPKLQELYRHLFNEEYPQTHTALDDIEHTAKCFFEMVRIGYIKLEEDDGNEKSGTQQES